jgi:type IV secretory pathway TraG/TraD family ATPase VirD4
VIEVVAGLALLVAVVVVALPVLVVAGAATLAARRASRRLLATGAGAAAAAGGVAVAVAGARSLGAGYLAPLRVAVGAISHHTHLSTGMVAGRLPGTLPVAIPVGVLVAAAWEARRRHAAKKNSPAQPSRDTAAPAPTRRQLAPLAVRPAAAAQRVVLGAIGRRLVAGQVEQHTAVIAPTRSGKTRGVVLPALLAWDGPVVATSTKADLLHDTGHGAGAYAWRAKRGPVWVYDPAGSSGYPCVGWSPLGRSRDWQGALRAARAMVDASAEGTIQNSTSQFFAARAAGVLSLVLYAVAMVDGTMADVAGLVRSAGSLAELADDLEEGMLGVPGAAREGLAAVGSLRSGSETSSGDVMATLGNVLGPFVDDPKVAASSEEVDFDPKTFIAARGTLFVVGSDPGRLAPLYACLVDEIVSHVAARTLAAGPLEPRLLLALDEIANIAPIEALPRLLATVGGQGVTVLTAWQSLGQMKRWGPSGPSEILGNSAAKLFAPSSDPETLEYLDRAMGRRLVESRSTSAALEQGLLGTREADAHSVGVSLVERQAFEAQTFSLASGPLLLHAGLPPTTLEWHHYDQDRALAKRSKLPLPEPEVEADLDAGLADAEVGVEVEADWAGTDPAGLVPAGDDAADWGADPGPAAPIIPGPASWWDGSAGIELADTNMEEE